MSRYCILRCASAKGCEEVRLALHGKHIEPYNGLLKCTSTTSETLSRISGLGSEQLSKIRLTGAEVKLSKINGYV